jgi:hypothetical protein
MNDTILSHPQNYHRNNSSHISAGHCNRTLLRQLSQFISDRIIMLAFMKENMMLSKKKHLIYMVLFNVLLINCGYVQARPNATTNLAYGSDDNNVSRECDYLSYHPWTKWCNCIHSHPLSVSNAFTIAWTTQFELTGRRFSCKKRRLCPAFNSTRSPRVTVRTWTWSCGWPCGGRGRTPCTRTLSSHHHRLFACGDALHYRYMDTICKYRKNRWVLQQRLKEVCHLIW